MAGAGDRSMVLIIEQVVASDDPIQQGRERHGP
jgi:hypothetical protein